MGDCREIVSETIEKDGYYHTITIKVKDGRVIYYKDQKFSLDIDGNRVLVGEETIVGGEIKK